MEFFRSARNPWGEEVLVGLSWDVFWLVVVLGALFVVGHAVLAARKKGDTAGTAADSGSGSGRLDEIPEKVERHGSSARISHWILALATFALLITAFVPILGLQFPWVTIHWVAGLVLTAYLLYHVVDTVRRGSLGTMWMGADEFREGMTRLRGFFDKEESDEVKPGKWGPENIAFHHLTAAAGIAVIVTGLLMMFRVDTWFWDANPYLLGISDAAWGWMYLLHGVASVGFVGLLMAHIYFAIRPDKLWITRSMFKGWITREEYLEHHDPDRWPVAGEGAVHSRTRGTSDRPSPTPTSGSPSPAQEGAGD